MDSVGLLRVKWQGSIVELPAPAPGSAGFAAFCAHDAVAARFNIPRDRLKLVAKGALLFAPECLSVAVGQFGLCRIGYPWDTTLPHDVFPARAHRPSVCRLGAACLDASLFDVSRARMPTGKVFGPGDTAALMELATDQPVMVSACQQGK